MKITQDVRDYAAARGIADESTALSSGMAEKAREFVQSGGEVYRSE
jgi:phosphomethylpyrimidine synthase